MTAAKSTRRRRRTSAESLPKVVAEWLRGERTRTPATPWLVLGFPGYALVVDWWQVWKEQHPEARPPAGYEWLEDPTSKRHPSEWLLELARKKQI